MQLSDITLLRPEALWLLPLVLVALVVRALVRRRRHVMLPTAPLLAARDFRPSLWRRLPIALAIAGIGLIAVALAEPVLPHTDAELQTLGIDIVLVMDLSSSMNAEMSGTGFGPTAKGPTRLDRTKAALRAIINRRHGDRLGLVVFSNYAYVVSPLTLERDYILRYLDIVDGEILKNEAMTAIGDGIDMGTFVLNKQSEDRRRSKVIMVFTDGERNYGRDPLDALKDADAAGIRVHLVGVDLDEQIKERPTVQSLIKYVRDLGGRYYEADTVRELRTAYSELDSLEKTLLVSRVHVSNEPVYHWFALAAVALLICALLLGTVPFFSDAI